MNIESGWGRNRTADELRWTLMNIESGWGRNRTADELPWTLMTPNTFNINAYQR